MTNQSGRWPVGALVALVCVGIVFATPGAAFSLVTTSAVANVPYIQIQGTGDSYARASTEIGSVVYVGGTFSTVFEPLTGTNYARHDLYAYDEGTKRVTSFAPSFNGEVWGLAHSPDGRYLYVAGNFSTVNGVARTGLARFDLTTGALTSFDAHLNGQARTVQYVNGHVIVGGAFTTVGGVSRVALASVDPTTGALQPSYLNAGLTGTVSSTAGPTAVFHSAVNPAGTQMALSGNFTSAGGATHWRVILLDLGTTSATVSGWNAQILQQPCDSVHIPNYVSGFSYAADGSWFAMSATGARNETGNGLPLSQTVCDAVSRWSATAAGNVAPTWVNYTGCDSLYAVLVQPDAVYVAGHNRWLDNPNACNQAGAGAVSRPGIGAVDPATGRALSWDPTRSRGRGADFLELTSLGLTVLSDCAAPGISGDPSSGSNYLAQTFHPCVGVLATPTPTTETLRVGKAGTGNGTITSSPAGISCGTTCSHDFTSGTKVTLTATPATGSSFSGWSGACTGTGTCTVLMSQTTSVSASFALRSETLGVSKAGAGSGTVASSPAGISCGSTCSHSFTFGTSVTLTATPATGSRFSGWSGACTGTGTCTVAMSQAESVTAGFVLRSESLRVGTAGSGSGRVVSRPAGISCGSTCSHGFAFGAKVTLTAKPGRGSSFGGWSGACTGTGACTVVMSQARSATATFVQELRGPRLPACKVPNLKGKKLKTAKRALRKAHCRTGKVSHKFSRHVRKGRVISQRPRSRRHLHHGAKVNLVVSKGKRR